MTINITKNFFATFPLLSVKDKPNYFIFKSKRFERRFENLRNYTKVGVSAIGYVYLDGSCVRVHSMQADYLTMHFYHHCGAFNNIDDLSTPFSNDTICTNASLWLNQGDVG